MTRTWMAAVVGMAAVAGSARADWGGFTNPRTRSADPSAAGTGEFNSPNTLVGMGSAHAQKAPERYGMLPGLRKLFHLGGKDDCATCGGKHGKNDGCGPGGCGPLGLGRPADPGYGGYGPYGPGGPGGQPGAMQGTLAFPHHTYLRSPRDYFMYEPGR